MIEYRIFKNSDTPRVAKLWNEHPPTRGRASPITPADFEHAVLDKPYFERKGLIVAVEGDRLMGFVHAGFGPAEDRRSLAKHRGAICMLLVRPHRDEMAVACALLTKAEDYLRKRGATTLFAGGFDGSDPFYLGLYGGAGSPGVLDSDTRSKKFFNAYSYRKAARVIVLQRDLVAFRPPVSRKLVKIRRSMELKRSDDPLAPNWWENCTLGPFEVVRYELVPKSSPTLLAEAIFWNMESFTISWGTHVVGLYRLHVDPQHRRSGLATFMLSEAMREIHERGFFMLEVQIRNEDTAAEGLLTKLGFRVVDAASILCKD